MARTFLFNTATGKRVYRSASERLWSAASRRLSIPWLLEITGVLLLAVAAWTVTPPAALVVVGTYAIIAANSGSDEE